MFRFDEFGNPEKGSAGRFGWLCGAQRRTELPSGVIQMGAELRAGDRKVYFDGPRKGRLG
jgi:hypothetical protein